MNPKTILSPFLLAALLVALAFTSCSKVNDMHDATVRMDATTARMADQTAAMNKSMEQMKADTEKMNENTQRLNDNTGQMKADTQNMEGVMTQLFDSARQGAALDLRNKQWELLRSSTGLEDKGTYAGLYFDSFEFQLWSNLGQDAAKGARARLEQDAVDEFFRRILGITHWAPEAIDPLAMKNPLNRLSDSEEIEAEKADFNAVSGSLERNNRKQEENSVSSQDQESMLRLIENGLTAGQQIRAGKAKLSDFPEYVNIVLQREELAIRLLRARVQVMGLATLGYVTTMTRSVTEGAAYVTCVKRMNLDFNTLNESQLGLISFRLGEGIAARDFLKTVEGIDVPLDSNLARVFSCGSVANAPGSKGAHATADSDLGRLQAQVLKQLHQYSGL